VSDQKEIRPAKRFSRHSSDSGEVKLSELGCPLCGSEMNADIQIKTVYGALHGPRASVSMRLQCNAIDCKYYERISADAHDDDTLKELERQALKFEAAIPSMGRWKRSNVATGKYQYRYKRRTETK
jgi:hypothetical protein